MGKTEIQEAVSVSSLGVMFLAIVGGSIFFGWKVDDWLGSSPVWILLGLLIGFVGGFYYLFATLFQSEKDEDEALPGADDTASDQGSDEGSDAPSE